MTRQPFSLREGSSRRVVVVGGGVTGLSAAWHLERSAGANAATEIRLLESAPRLGGQVRTERVDGLLLEGGPDSLVAQKPAGVKLCAALGLGDEIVRPPGRGPAVQVVHRGRLVPLPEGFLMVAPTRVRALIGSPLFSWRGKLRMLCEPLVPVRRAPHDDESLRDFVVRRLGREAFERAAEPVVGGLFTADADRLSLAMVMPRFIELERSHGSVVRGLRRSRLRAGRHAASAGGFAWLREGMGGLVDGLRRQLASTRVETGVRVDEIRFEPERGVWTVQPSGAAPLEADAVILACPAFAAAALLRHEDAPLSGELDALEYASCATVNLLYDRSQLRAALVGHGFFVPRSERLPLLACSYVSAKFGGRVPHDRVLLRAFVGGALDPDVLERDDASIEFAAHEALARLLRIEGPPLFARTHRFAHAMPQYPVGHPRSLVRLRQRLENHPGLCLAGSSLGSIGIPDCIASGERAAEGTWRYLSEGRRGLRQVV